MNNDDPVRPALSQDGLQTFATELVTDPDRLVEFEATWRGMELQYPEAALYDDFSEAVSSLTASDGMRLVVFRCENIITGFAPFIVSNCEKRYTVGERRLFSLPARTYSLIGRDYTGAFPPVAFAEVLQSLAKAKDCQVIELRDIATTGRLYTALCSTNAKRFLWRNRSRKQAIHWVIDLPGSMDQFYAQLKHKARQNRRREFRKVFETRGGSVVRVTKPDQVEWFLSVAEQISRTTYQWDLGQRLTNDSATQRRFRNAAEKGRLRCYVLTLDDTPCAFIRGILAQDTYRYETPGYDPKFSADSVGTVLMLYAIEDLISNTSCRIFDFGEGGDDSGYKSQFGNRCYDAVTVDVISRRRIYPGALLSLQDGINAAKNFASIIVGTSGLRPVLRRWLKGSPRA